MFKEDCSKMFKSKVVIVTGSSTGLGAATAIKFSSEGANVILHGRNESALQEVKKQCEKAGHGLTKVNMCIGDITDDNVRKNLINSAVENFGQLDVLVNNAGIGTMAPISEANMEDYDKIFNVNVRSLMAMTQLALPHLIKSKGNIVNISSVVALKPNARAPFYACSKAAVDHFTKCVAMDMGPKGVRVNSVNPGLVPETSFFERQGGMVEGVVERVKALIPMGRTVTPDEIADAILFIASDKARFVTGVIFPVDGGFTKV